MNESYYRQTSIDHQYFADRLNDPYRSTLALEQFSSRLGFFSTLEVGSLVVDVACGTGSETAWLATRYPTLNFLGVDLQPHFIEAAQSRYRRIQNVQFVVGDLYHLDEITQWSTAHGVWMSQTLSWMEWWSKELSCLLGPQVDRIALSTLAWDGPTEAQVIHYLGRRGDDETQIGYSNVYSISAMCEQMRKSGFDNQAVEKFIIDIDLEPPEHGGHGSYTVRLESGERMTFSTWQYMPWHFFLFSKSKLTAPV